MYTLLDTPETPSQQARTYLATDPALVVLYKQLRDKTLQTLKGASKVAPRAEWDFVMQTARIYDRMGCDLLALDLGDFHTLCPVYPFSQPLTHTVRNWEFLQPSKDTLQPMTDIPDPRKMLRRRSSLVVDDLTSPTSPTAKKHGASQFTKPQAFEEPDANSLLDSFGF